MSVDIVLRMVAWGLHAKARTATPRSSSTENNQAFKTSISRALVGGGTDGTVALAAACGPWLGTSIWNNLSFASSIWRNFGVRFCSKSVNVWWNVPSLQSDSTMEEPSQLTPPCPTPPSTHRQLVPKRPLWPRVPSNFWILVRAASRRLETFLCFSFTISNFARLFFCCSNKILICSTGS